MKLLWPVGLVLSLVSTGVGARIDALERGAGLLWPLFFASTAASVLLLAFLLFDYKRDVGSKYRGSDILRMRVAVITFGDIGIILLVVGVPLAGIGLLALTLACYAHGTIASKELRALHAEWDAEREAGEAARKATADAST